VRDLDPTVLLVDLEFDALGELLDGWIFSFRDGGTEIRTRRT
jgi:hypothetical protein